MMLIGCDDPGRITAFFVNSLLNNEGRFVYLYKVWITFAVLLNILQLV